MKKQILGSFFGMVLAGLSGALCASHESAPCDTKSKTTPPNIVLILCDDMGINDPECYGSKINSTPQINALAQSGIRFTRCYAAESVCTPSRAGLLTGCYPNRLGLGGHALWFNAQKGLNPDVPTLSSRLKKANYATACFGKWHLGHLARFMPNAHGFDRFEGIPYSNSMWHLRNDGSTAKFPKLPYYRDSQVIDYIDTFEKMDNLTERLTRQAELFIAESAQKKTPFFLYLAHPQPHVPLACSAPFKGRSPNGRYSDVMAELDSSTGRIIHALEAANIRSETIVIFTSDNGPWLHYGNHAGSAAPFREGKATAFEGGFRVPFIISYPGKIPAGRVSNELISLLDMMPTLADYANCAPDSQIRDGFDLRPFLSHPDEVPSPRREFTYFFGRERRAQCRETTKTFFPHTYNSYELGTPGADGQVGKCVQQKIKKETYDLSTDPEERRPLPADFREKTGKK